jgi:hypothetical protein
VKQGSDIQRTALCSNKGPEWNQANLVSAEIETPKGNGDFRGGRRKLILGRRGPVLGRGGGVGELQCFGWLGDAGGGFFGFGHGFEDEGFLEDGFEEMFGGGQASRDFGGV